MTWVKVCGITNREDAETAVGLGADALGFVFTPSRRRIQPQKAGRICGGLSRSVERIGVFVNMDMDEVREIAELCGLSGLQFHGSEMPGYCRRFKGLYTVMKAFRVDGEKGWDEIPAYIRAGAVHRILLDTYVPGIPGGTGRTFPWPLAKGRDWGAPVVIAGGINPLNVAQAVREACPFGIDVGSGVEMEPGKKDRKKLRQLFCSIKKLEII